MEREIRNLDPDPDFLLILDSGDTSVAVAHVNPEGTLKVIDKGAKQNGVPYFVNTYLGFYSETPRP